MSNGFLVTENPFFKHDIDKLCLICNHQFKMDQTPHSILDRLEQTQPELLMDVYDALESISKFKEIKLQKQTEKVCDCCFKHISRVIRFCEMCNKSASFLKSYLQYQEMNNISQNDITDPVTHGDRTMLTELMGLNVLSIKPELLDDHEEEDVQMQVWPEFVTISTVDTLSSTTETTMLEKEEEKIAKVVCTKPKIINDEVKQNVKMDLCTNVNVLYDEMEQDVKLEIWPELPTITTDDTLNCTAAILVKEEMGNISEKGITNIENCLERPTTATLINADKAIGIESHDKIIVNGAHRVKCIVCHRFYNQDYINIHMRIHTGVKPYSCTICDKTFRTASGIWSHNQANIDLHDLPCIICGKSFKTRSQAKKNTSEGPNECKNEPHECKYEPRARKPFECEKCGKCFSTRKGLKQHIIIHVEVKKYECKVCGNKFRTARYLTMHLISVHSVEEPFACEKCGKCFSTRERFKEHMLSHFQANKHECKVCGRIFPHLSRLKEHLSYHSDEKRFVCEKCGKCLLSRKRLREHMSCHSDERPFECEKCGKFFSGRHHLKQHMVSHLEVKRHECHLCGNRFKHPHSVRIHLSNHCKGTN